MTFFSLSESNSFQVNHSPGEDDSGGSQRFDSKLLELHRALYTKMRNHNLHIYPYSRQPEIVRHESAAGSAGSDLRVVPYFRSGQDAVVVERLMGREVTDTAVAGEAHLHPVIELRLTPDYFAVEMLLTPAAWWDQLNLVGKLSVKRHRAAFYKLLQDMAQGYRIGFWSGIHLSEMHLTTEQLTQARALDAWMDTFEEGQDNFRIGYWFDLQDPTLETQHIVPEIFERMQSLYKIYAFLLWTGNNNFHDLYHGKLRKPAYA